MQSSDIDMVGTNIGDELPITTQILTLKSMMFTGSKASPSLGNILEKYPTAHELSSMKDHVINENFRNISLKKNNRKALDFAPPWIVHDSSMPEHNTNWRDIYVTIFEEHVDSSENVVRSHVVYKFKADQDEQKH